MPPLYPHDPLAALESGAAWRWADVPVAFAGVAGEPWVLALVALALFAWLEQEVRDVMGVFVPFAAALALSAALALLARSLGAVPRPVGGAGQSAAPLLRALAGGQAAAVSALAVYSILAYGRRARAALLFAIAFAVGRALAGPGWVLELAGGAVAGGTIASAVYVVGVKLFPRGALVRLRRVRRSSRPGRLAAPPSP